MEAFFLLCAPWPTIQWSTCAGVSLAHTRRVRFHLSPPLSSHSGLVCYSSNMSWWLFGLQLSRLLKTLTSSQEHSGGINASYHSWKGWACQDSPCSEKYEMVSVKRRIRVICWFYMSLGSRVGRAVSFWTESNGFNPGHCQLKCISDMANSAVSTGRWQ